MKSPAPDDDMREKTKKGEIIYAGGAGIINELLVVQ
jgi:hypothetical protein